MYEDDTIRLFGVANLLKNKKNNSNNWDRDDIPDVKPQALTGKYDHNFDAPGSDFVRAHNYNFHNIDQPENTKSDVKYDDKYTKFFNYTPSKYIQLEEEEYKPFSKYNEKADEYYIDSLQGKTLDDMVIRKMKENAGAEDVDPRAGRERFAEYVTVEKNRIRLDNELKDDERLGGEVREARLEMFGNMEEEGAGEVMEPKSKREQRKINKSKQQQHKVQIEPVHQSPQKNSKSKKSVKYADEVQEGGGGGAYVSPKKIAKAQDEEARQKQLELQEKEAKYRAIEEKQEKGRRKKKEEEEEAKKEKNAKDKQTLGNVFGALKRNAKEAKQAKAQHESQLQNKVLKQLQQNVGKQRHNKELEEHADMHHKNQLQGKALTQLSKNAQQKKIEEYGNQHHKRQSLQKAFNTLRSNKKVDWDEQVDFSEKEGAFDGATDAATTDAASYMVGGEPEGIKIPAKRGQHPNTQAARSAAYQKKLELKLPVVLDYKKAYENIPNDSIVSRDVIRQYNKDVTPKNALRVTGPILTVGQFKKLIDEEEKRRKPNPKLTAEALSDFNTPKKGGKSDISGSLSPLQSIQGMISHNNPKSSK